jgi:hypothetical protein
MPVSRSLLARARELNSRAGAELQRRAATAGSAVISPGAGPRPGQSVLDLVSGQQGVVIAAESTNYLIPAAGSEGR